MSQSTTNPTDEFTKDRECIEKATPGAWKSDNGPTHGIHISSSPFTGTMKDWRKITVNGETFITRSNPGPFIIKLAKIANKNKKGEYFLDNGRITFHDVMTIGTWRVEGPYKEKSCKTKINICGGGRGKERSRN